MYPIHTYIVPHMYPISDVATGGGTGVQCPLCKKNFRLLAPSVKIFWLRHYTPFKTWADGNPACQLQKRHSSIVWDQIFKETPVSETVSADEMLMAPLTKLTGISFSFFRNPLVIILFL